MLILKQKTIFKSSISNPYDIFRGYILDSLLPLGELVTLNFRIYFQDLLYLMFASSAYFLALFEGQASRIVVTILLYSLLPFPAFFPSEFAF